MVIDIFISYSVCTSIQYAYVKSLMRKIDVIIE